MSSGERISNENVNESDRDLADIERIKQRMAALGIANSDYIALTYMPRKKNDETGEWDRVMNASDKPLRLPVLLSLENIGICPIPLSELPDEVIDQFLRASDVTVNKLSETPEKFNTAQRVGKMMIAEFKGRQQEEEKA